MNLTVLLVIAAVVLVGLILLPRFKKAVGARPMLVNLSTVNDTHTVDSLLADGAFTASYCGDVAEPYGLLFVPFEDGRLIPGKGWKPASSPDKLADMRDRLAHEDARLRAVATAQDTEGVRTVLGYVYSPGTTAPHPSGETPGSYTIRPVAPFRPKDPRH